MTTDKQIKEYLGMHRQETSATRELFNRTTGNIFERVAETLKNAPPLRQGSCVRVFGTHDWVFYPEKEDLK